MRKLCEISRQGGGPLRKSLLAGLLGFIGMCVFSIASSYAGEVDILFRN